MGRPWAKHGKEDGRVMQLTTAVFLLALFAIPMGCITNGLCSRTGTAIAAKMAVTSAPALRQVTGYTFWSSDFHISPIADLKNLFVPMGMTVIDKSLSGHCGLKGTCAKDLKVLTTSNGISLGNCPNKLKREFFEAYRDDPEMNRVDAFLCNHAASMCEVFMPFNKPLIVMASTRYEIGRHSAEQWETWNDNLRRIAANPRNIVAANNMYDAEYIKYFTGIQNVHVLPNNCGYVQTLYSPKRTEILVGPGRGVNEALFQELRSQGQSANFTFSRVRDLYPAFKYSDLTQHPAVVLIPYQVSIMSIFEYYRMAIPMFAPSVGLLTKWHLKHRLMAERTWEGAYGRMSTKSPIPRHPRVTVPHDPNNDNDEEAIKYWLQLSDFYVWPHIQTYDSWEDLIGKLQAADLEATSRAMQAHSAEWLDGLKETWQGHFRRIFDQVPPAAQQPKAQELDFDHALQSAYGVQLLDCHGQKETAQT